MKRIIQTALLISCVLGMAMGQPAHAAQFNVTVPINLSRMPADATHVIVKGFLLCGHHFDSTAVGVAWHEQVGGSIGEADIVGFSQQISPINTATGEFHRSILLSLNVAPGFFPNNVSGYAYVVSLKWNGEVIEPDFLMQTINPGVQGNSFVFYNSGTFINPARIGTRCDDSDFTK